MQMTETSSYEGHRLSPDHPQHRDVLAIFQLEVIETDELEEGVFSHYPIPHDIQEKYKGFLHFL